MSRLARLAAGAAVVLAVGLAVVLADSPRDHGRAAVTSTSPADGATLARAPTEVALSFMKRRYPGLLKTEPKDTPPAKPSNRRRPG